MKYQIIKRALTIALVVVGVSGVFWVAKGWTLKKPDPKLAKFNADCDSLIMGIQQYKEFVGSYPTGNPGAQRGRRDAETAGDGCDRQGGCGHPCGLRITPLGRRHG